MQLPKKRVNKWILRETHPSHLVILHSKTLATNEGCQLTLDLDGLLHLWVGLEHTLVLSAGAVGDLVQAATQTGGLGTLGNTPATQFLPRRPTGSTGSRTNDSQEVFHSAK